MANSEFLQETILKESAYGIAVAQMSENNYFLKVIRQVVSMHSSSRFLSPQFNV